jgi:hypothetical protein
LGLSDKLHVLDVLPSGQEPRDTLFIGGNVGPKTNLDAAAKPDNISVSKFNIHGLSTIRKKVMHIIKFDPRVNTTFEPPVETKIFLQLRNQHFIIKIPAPIITDFKETDKNKQCKNNKIHT